MITLLRIDLLYGVPFHVSKPIQIAFVTPFLRE